MQVNLDEATGPRDRRSLSHKFYSKDNKPCANSHIQGPDAEAMLMSADPQLVYSLEIKVLDLESKLASLEKTVDRLMHEVGTVGPARLPEDVMEQISSGENPVRAVRQYRLMTQKELGERSGIRANHISAIERGMPYGLKTAKRLSNALEIPVGLLT